MSASPELTLSPFKFSLSPIAPAVRLVGEHGRILSSLKADHIVAGYGECRTPTSEDSKLPCAPPSCPPPAPRKTTRRVVLCKRKLSSEFELIVVGAKEMEQLFRPRDQQQRPEAAGPDHEKKRKCQQLDC